MDRRCRALESSGDQPEVSTPKTTPEKVHQEAYSSTVEHSASCQIEECSGSHSISQCDRYKQLGTREKKAVVRKLKLCMNCLGRHFVADCPSKFSCRTCNGRHRTSLHFDRAVEQQSGVTSGATFSGPSVLLSTAMVGIDDTTGKTLMFRALLDSGSQTSFITADAASKLNLARSTVDVKISGIGGRQQAAKESVSLLVRPQKLPITALSYRIQSQGKIKEMQPPSISGAAAPSSGSLTTKLPNLTLPSFSGEYTQWVSFWDQFTTLVDSKRDMTNVEKLSYLKLSMKGDAAQMVSSLLVTDANYDIAKRKLKERYNNKRSIVKAHLAAIHALPAVKNESSVELRKLLESTNEHVQALEALMLPVNHWDAILAYWPLEKLDAESRKQFELANPGTDVLTFKELTTFMGRRCRALESSGDQPEVSTPKTTPEKVHQEAYSSTVEHSASCQMEECSGSHSISQCDRYKQLGTREKQAVVRKLKLCMNCLRRHFVADCPSKFSCRTCNGRHRTSLHFDRAVEQQSGVTSCATFSGPSVLLSTAMVGIDDTTGKTLMFRALLDSGSQTSFITADAASKLNLARSTVDVKISGIGGRQQAAKESVSLLVGPQKLPITALSYRTQSQVLYLLNLLT